MPKQFSHSALSSFRSCPKQFWFKYVEKPEVARRVTADTYMGNAVHRTLRELYEAVSHGRVLPKDQLLAIYDREWEKPPRSQISVVNENLAVDDYIASGRRMLSMYYDRNHPFDDGTLLGTELRLRFVLPGTPYSFVAIIDRLWKRPDGIVEIIDYKTGRHLPKGGRDPKFFSQMGIYQLAVEQSFPDQFEQIDVSQYFLKMDEIVRFHLTKDDLDELRLELKGTIAEIAHAERLDDFPARETDMCFYCDYMSLCPAKRHRLLLDTEAGTATGDERTTAVVAADLAEQFLELDRKYKLLKEEHAAMKHDVVKAAADLAVEKLAARSGDVKISSRTVEKFITRGSDKRSFADFVHTVKELGLEAYLEPNTSAIMREVYKRDILNDEQKEMLRRFIIEKEEVRVLPVHADPDDLDN